MPDGGHELTAIKSLQRRIHLAALLTGALAVVWLNLTLPPVDSIAFKTLRAVLLAAYLGAIPWLRRRPDDQRWIAVLLMAATTLSLFLRAWLRAPGPFPEILDLLPATCFFATVFGDALLADGLCVATALGLLAFGATHPASWRDLSVRHVSNLVLIVAIQQLLLRAFWKEVVRGVRNMGAVSAALAEEAKAIQALAADCFEDVALRVQALDRALTEGDRAAAADSTRALSAHLHGVRRELTGMPEPPPAEDAAANAARIQHRLRGLTLAFFTVAIFVAAVRNAVLIPGGEALVWRCLPLFSAALWIRWRRPAMERLFFRAAVSVFVVFMLSLAKSQLSRAPGAFAPSQCALSFACVVAALADEGRFSLPLLLAVLLSVLAEILWMPGYPSDAAVVVAMATAVGCWLAAQFPRRIFEGLEAQKRRLETAVLHRRRLVSMLFHDLANPLQVVSLLLETDGDPSRAGRMAGRMMEVLETARSLEREDLETTAVRVDEMLDSLDDLFKERLLAKGLSLRLLRRCNRRRVTAQPQLLLEGVLGNLVSNAIKFSPNGGTITVDCVEAEEGVHVTVANEGQALPEAVLSALRQGRRAPSAEGTAGEQGSGYGLMLVADYLRRMDGDLTLAPGPQGGALALVRLRGA